MNEKRRSFDTSGDIENAGQVLPREEQEFLAMSPLEQQAHLILDYWQGTGEYQEACRALSSSENLRDQARILKKAHRVVRKLAPLLRAFKQVPTVSLSCGNETWDVKVTDILAAGGLLWIASWLSQLKPTKGRPSHGLIAGCAEELAQASKRETGEPDWPWVADKITKHFPEIVSSDDTGRDPGKWIYNLVKRHRKKREEILKRQKQSNARLVNPVGDFLPEKELVLQDVSPEYSAARAVAFVKISGGKDLREPSRSEVKP